ncbi:DNA translocase FtsK [Mastigocoleus testarum]|uniref:Cell division protein FtsK n=1 Tax=Mastigocoleus testarum BC008 TaxID=371196 RepID=A0A0V8A0Q0_9CYAN|nr:DNA translocase FtsK [Mastigocoleus testarum]KST66839.1 cell division protein FtsK [Mastigocoleus testarum BC008]KST70177.1 cell division protein FtsK [Mastigocoleus testarum BC008]
MQYLIQANEIKAQIAKFSLAKVLWLDTEIADYWTAYPRLSLIQVSSDYTDNIGESTCILDVLDKPELAEEFIKQIMLNPQIVKVFHNASFDLKYLGGKSAKNVICTLKIARKITKQVLQTSNLKLKTLAVELCHFSNVDTEEGRSNWGKRPLSQKQLQYAAMDTVYLAAVHLRLLEVSKPDAVREIFDMVSESNNPISNSKTNSGNLSLSPTKVRVAFECPRLFYLSQYFGGRTLFSPPDKIAGIGSIFHQLADKFVNLAVCEPRFQEIFHLGGSQLQIEKVALDMQQLFYQLKFSSYLDRVIAKDPSKAPALLRLWEGIQGLIKRFAALLVTNRNYCSAETVIRNTFITEKRQLEHYFSLPDGSEQRVVGAYDCLVFNFERKRLGVLEFKTYQPVDPSAQLAQVALYSYMLWHKKKVAVDAAVYCVLPEFKEYQYTWEQLENTVHQLIPYKLQQMGQWLNWEAPHPNPPPETTQLHLCDICPQQQKCQSYFSAESLDRTQTTDVEDPHVFSSQKQDFLTQREFTENYTTGNKFTENKSTENNSAENNSTKYESISWDVDATGEELVNTLESFGIGVDYQGVAIAPAFIRVKLKPHLGVKVISILRLSADLQVHLGLENPPLITPQAGYVSVDLPRPDRQIAEFTNYVQNQSLSPTVSVKIAIGVNLNGKLIEANLSDPNTCHFLVGGTTGSGKSEFLRSLLLSLLVRHSPKNLQIALVDPKRVTFPEFEGIEWLHSPIVKDSDRAIELMEELVEEMELRYQKFETARCADISAYNQKNSQPLSRIVCIFDEYADFMAEKEIRKTLELNIKRLGAMARAAGIHLIIATQRPEAKVVTPIIRSNLPGRVALRTASEADSCIVLGSKETAAAYLLGKGDLLYQSGSQLQRLQSLLATNIHFT